MRIASSDDLAAIVRTVRKQQRLTQADLAGVSGVGIRFVIDLEAGKPTCQIEKVFKVLQMLGLNVSVEARGGGTF